MSGPSAPPPPQPHPLAPFSSGECRPWASLLAPFRSVASEAPLGNLTPGHNRIPTLQPSHAAPRVTFAAGDPFHREYVHVRASYADEVVAQAKPLGSHCSVAYVSLPFERTRLAVDHTIWFAVLSMTVDNVAGMTKENL